MIVITGARGFIGSNLIEKLNAEGYEDLILVDEIENKDKNIKSFNFIIKNYTKYLTSIDIFQLMIVPFFQQ